jgi:ribosome biogenesis protein Tsr3
MNVVIDHALWCGHCGKYLGAANPSVRVFGKVLCLRCVEALREALLAQAEADKARER